MQKHYTIYTSSLMLLLAGWLTACTSEETWPVDATEAVLSPRFYMGASETRSIITGVTTSTSPTGNQINKVMLFVTLDKKTDDTNAETEDGYTPYPGVTLDDKDAGLSTFTYTAGSSGSSGGSSGSSEDAWIGVPPVNLSSMVARIYAFSPHDAAFTTSTADTNHSIKVTVPATQTFNGANSWECSATDYLYGSSSATAGDAQPITASNKATGGEGIATYNPTIHMQHALSLLEFYMNTESGRDVTDYDYVKEVWLSTTDGTNQFLISGSTDDNYMLIKDGSLTLSDKTNQLKFTASANVQQCGVANATTQTLVAYGLVGPLSTAPSDLTLTVVLDKQTEATDSKRELSVSLSPKAWVKGNRYKFFLTLTDRAITVAKTTISSWGEHTDTGSLDSDGPDPNLSTSSLAE